MLLTTLLLLILIFSVVIIFAPRRHHVLVATFIVNCLLSAILYTVVHPLVGALQILLGSISFFCLYNVFLHVTDHARDRAMISIRPGEGALIGVSSFIFFALFVAIFSGNSNFFDKIPQTHMDINKVFEKYLLTDWLVLGTFAVFCAVCFWTIILLSSLKKDKI